MLAGCSRGDRFAGPVAIAGGWKPGRSRSSRVSSSGRRSAAASDAGNEYCFSGSLRAQGSSAAGSARWRPARLPGLGRLLPGGDLALGPIDKLLPQLGGPGLVVPAAGILATRSRTRRGLGLGGQVGGEELAAERGEQLAIEPAAVAEADLQLGGMDVHVDHVGRHLDGEKGDRIASHHEQPAIGLGQGVLQGVVADVPAVEEQVLHAVIAAALAGMGHAAADPHVAVAAFDEDQPLGQLAAEEGRNPLDGILARTGRSNTCRSLCRKVKWTRGRARAIRVKASLMWPNSVCGVRMNFRRTGVL